MKSNLFKSVLLVSALFLLGLTSLTARAQQDQTGDLTQTREITSDVFTQKRPVSDKKSTKVKTPATKKPTVATTKRVTKTTYKLKVKQPPRRQKTTVGVTTTASKNNKTQGETSVVAQLGITFWRLRPERSSDTGARLLTQGGGGILVAERVALDTVFRTKDKVRISIESPRAGFLYVIDREMRADGTVGDAYLIFPTLTTRDGNNAVSAGVPIEIPAQSDEPFYFDITPTEKNYSGELLTVILSPVKIRNLQISNEPLLLRNGLVEEWETNWEKTASFFELDKDDAAQYTEEEKEAGSGRRQLTQNSPPPKNMIAVKVSKGDAFLVSFALNVKN